MSKIQLPKSGFTLAELLIALSILGIIAAFVIPKVLINQQNSQYNAIAKEAIGTVSQAYVDYKNQNSPSAATSGANLTPYINYVKVDTTSAIDLPQFGGSTTCSNNPFCLKLHNGSMLMIWPGMTFNGTGTLNGFLFYIDPDGKVTDGTTTGPGKSLTVFLYYNGRIMDHGNIPAGTTNANGVYNPQPPNIPPWFSW